MTSTDKPEFTPGPWHQPNPEEDYRFAVTGDRVVAAENGFIVAMVIHDSPPDAEPNAHLITAAPELYEVAVMIRDADDDCRRDGLPRIPAAARAKIDAAIAKAEGRT